MSSSVFIVVLRSGGVFETELIDIRPGLVILKVAENKVFENEAGLHQWQRIPPTEKKGRTQTSLISVAVLPDVEEGSLTIEEKDLEWSTTRGSGPGGQNRNKVETVAVVKHKPSGITVRAESERSQYRNKTLALELLRSKLQMMKDEQEQTGRAQDRRSQIGMGQRGDKRRTIRVKDGIVKDHLTGKTWSYTDYVKGEW